jgi:hypothetical protein
MMLGSLRVVAQEIDTAEQQVKALRLTERDMVVLRKSIGPEMCAAVIAFRNELTRIMSRFGSNVHLVSGIDGLNAMLVMWGGTSDASTGSAVADQPAWGGPPATPGGNRSGGEDPYESLRSRHGDRAVMVVVTGLPTNSDPARGVTKRDVEVAIANRLKDLAPGATLPFSMGSGDLWATCLTPIEDLKRLAGSIDFGKASTRLRRVDVTVSQQFIASAPRLPAPAAIAAAPSNPSVDEPRIPEDSDPLTKSIIQLKSPEVHRKKDAVTRLRRITPNDRLGEVVAALLPLLDHDDGFLVNDVVQTLEVWRSPEAVPKLIERANDDRFFVRKQAIKTLGKYKDARAAEPIAAHLKEDGFEAEEALKAIGPAAEPALIERLKDSENDVRRRACNILKYVGGTETLKAMQSLPPDPEFSVRIAATEAMKQIVQRVGPLKASAAMKKTGKR